MENFLRKFVSLVYELQLCKDTCTKLVSCEVRKQVHLS